MNILIRSLFAFTLVGLCGCGKSVDGPPPSPEAIEKMRHDRIKAYVDDKSLSDEQVFKKYLDENRVKPMIQPKEVGVWAEVTPIGGGIPGSMLTVKRLDSTELQNTAKNDPLKLEREGIKAAAEFCEETLNDLQARNVKAISYQLYGKIAGTDNYSEVFRVTVTAGHLPKLAAAHGPADAGTAYDPRGPKINDIWKVEKNDYPKFTYNKK